jgi:glutamyl/glutaminyl-tRNA synthetase
MQVFARTALIARAHAQGPDKPGNCGPYRQSERKEIYAKMAKQLVDSGAAYPCFTTGKRAAATHIHILHCYNTIACML